MLLTYREPPRWWRDHYGSSAARIGVGRYTLADLKTRVAVIRWFPDRGKSYRPAGMP